MKVSYMLEYVQTLEKSYEDTLRRAVSSKTDKRYIQVISEMVSFISSIKTFLNKAMVLDKVLSELKAGRACFKWFYSEDRSYVSLTRIDPQIGISYNGTALSVSYLENSISFNERVIEIKLNEFRDSISINDIDDIIAKRSVIMKLIGEASTALLKYSDEFSICAKAIHR